MTRILHMNICGGYRFEHIYFEWHNHCGPCFLRRKDSEPKPQQFRPMRDYKALARWEKLSTEQQEKFRVY